jgi:hypothetical protein
VRCFALPGMGFSANDGYKAEGVKYFIHLVCAEFSLLCVSHYADIDPLD